MYKRLHLAALALAAFCSGCDQLVTVEPVEDSSAARTLTSKTELDTIPSVPATTDFTVLTDPWSQYFRSDPVIYLIPSLSEGVEQLLGEQQELARDILSTSGKIVDRPEYIQLEEQLAELKLAVPGAETASGYGRGYRRDVRSPGYAYVAPDGSYAESRTSRGYTRYYTVFRRVHKSSSPALARSVESIVYNASVEDIGQRIAALRQLISKWSRRTSVMSPNGVEGVMREANEAYLDSLKEYTSDWLGIQERLRRVETSIQAAEERKLERLEEWRRFEENRLPVIAEYIERQHSERVSHAGGRYQIPGALLNDHIILLACEIGERRLFFDLTQGTHSDHPFRLIAMGH
jgi:hypothetical protein